MAPPMPLPSRQQPQSASSLAAASAASRQGQREVDEASIASDFSVIPESLVDLEVTEDGSLLRRGGGRGGGEEVEEEEENNLSTSFLHSADLHISSTAMETHSKVQFHQLQPTYFLDSDIPVTFSLGSKVAPESSDRVALYKVGFGTIQDYVDYLWAPVPTPHQRQQNLPLTVVFKASSFQREQFAGEFFQFCYVTHSGAIVGVSGPFQLLRVGAAGREVCGVEEVEAEAGGRVDDPLVVVRSTESVLQERLVKLSEEREELQRKVEEAEERKGEVERKVEEQSQQLSLCQHHLMALEVKLKKETSEKCELMGRVGQVVEERGHLEERVREAERKLAKEREKTATLEEKLAQAGEKERTLEETSLTSRKALEETTLKLKRVESDLEATQTALKAAQGELQVAQGEREKAMKDLAFWTANAETDQQEKNSLALKYSEVTEELISRQEELEESRKKSFLLEEKLEKTLEELVSVKAHSSTLSLQVEDLLDKEKIYVERESVLKADLALLKVRLAAVEEEERTEKQGREAAEIIASDLSARLQAARSEYQTLALTNHRLVKKVKRMRSRGEASVSSMGTEPDTDAKITRNDAMQMTASTASWVCADVEREEEEEDKEEEEEEEEEGASTALTQSCCSQTTQQLSEAVNRKMEDIVRELSQQILSLKHQLEEKEKAGRDGAAAEEEERDARRPGANVEAAEPQGAEGGQSESTPSERRQTTPSDPVLYGNTFLPAAPTAPVFLPERSPSRQPPIQAPATPQTPPQPQPVNQSTGINQNATRVAAVRDQNLGPVTVSPPQTMQPTDPIPAPRVQYYHPQPPSHPCPPQGRATGGLPPPMLPETTPLARQVAVLSQFSHTGNSSSSSSSASSSAPASAVGLPTAPPLLPPPGLPPQDSEEEEDYHSTDSDGNSNSVVGGGTQRQERQQQQQQPQEEEEEEDAGVPPLAPPSPGTDPSDPPMLECPMCHLCFPLGTLRLLEEHINSHLEYVCPVCSQAFQRNCRERFEEHVQSHFQEEEEEEARRREAEEQGRPQGNSGPWASTSKLGAFSASTSKLEAFPSPTSEFKPSRSSITFLASTTGPQPFPASTSKTQPSQASTSRLRLFPASTSKLGAWMTARPEASASKVKVLSASVTKNHRRK